MSETTDWNSGQGAYPSDRNEWVLRIETLPPAEPTEVTRHLSTRPTLEEIRSLCGDEMGDTEREVRVQWYLTDSEREVLDHSVFTLKPTGDPP